MIFDSDWLVEHLDGAPDLDTVAERLTDCGCLVELREPGDGAEKWDVEVTTNRPDTMNHRGLAREAAVATGSRLRPIEFELSENDEDASDLVTIEIDDPELCSRYVARIIRGVSVGASPDWMQRRLLNCGVRPINAVVDATNFVLLELGQPLHAFDLDLVRGRQIIVRSAKDGEKLTTLDGEGRELDPSMLMIADGEGVVALAGIMGGADSEIHDDTVDVLLESAHFNALSVRRTARRLGMHTEASHRFERGTDPEMAAIACDRAAALIAELAGGQVCRGRIDIHPAPWEARRMEISVSSLSAFAGLEIPAERAVQILQGLEFSPELAGDIIRVSVPPHRVDIDRVTDLYEEVIRHVGYDAVPSELPVLPTTPGRRNPNWELIDRTRDAAVATGLVEIMTWSFIDPDVDELVATHPLCLGAPLPLQNPLAQTQGTMRRSLLPGLLDAAGTNFNQGEQSIAMFEQGRVFGLGEEGGPCESERLGVVLSGDMGNREDAFSRLKGIVEDVLARVGLPSVIWKNGGDPWLDPDAGAKLVTDDGTVIALAGGLSRDLAQRWDVRHDVMVAEIDLGLATEPPLARFEALPRHPSVVMDMTVEHAQELGFAELESAVRSLAGDWVEEMSYVTQFKPKGEPRLVRTTLRLVYRHSERSLTQEEVNAAHEELRQGLAEKLGVAFA
ncbi:MAG: phenylalanine--tRNA ligase subunit beta [Acidobacteria bacterium]|jgi:phenylalanyl-tRNA synthetase beta chain|nr:phenylalanine--tRNA ligase subunit beta [Acidobacteriota bacterium]